MSDYKISLRAARVNAGMTQDQVAKMMHKNKQTVVNWEAGRTDISFRDVLKLCRIYDVPIQCVKDPAEADEKLSLRNK